MVGDRDEAAGESGQRLDIEFRRIEFRLNVRNAFAPPCGRAPFCAVRVTDHAADVILLAQVCICFGDFTWVGGTAMSAHDIDDVTASVLVSYRERVRVAARSSSSRIGVGSVEDTSLRRQFERSAAVDGAVDQCSSKKPLMSSLKSASHSERAAVGSASRCAWIAASLSVRLKVSDEPCTTNVSSLSVPK